MRWARITIAVVIAEAVPILLLIAVVAAFGPKERAAAQAYAERAGQWIGPIAGAAMCLLMGWWAARKTPSRAIWHGVATGLGAAGIDVALLIASGTTFRWLFVASNVGRLVCGLFGGWIATRISSRSREI
jgi:hypothetical protein